MNTTTLLQTWDVLKEFGFQPDETVYSDIHPGLCFDFGVFKLSASAVLVRIVEKVVMFIGYYETKQDFAIIEFDIPREVESREQCAAWLAFRLIPICGKNVQVINAAPWLAVGLANQRLLPWIREREARFALWDARPLCIVSRAFVRPLLKRLVQAAGQLPPDKKIWFAFDGEILRIRSGDELLAVAADGSPWPNMFGIDAGQLAIPLGRLMNEKVSFEFWDGRFRIANRCYVVVTDLTDIP